MKSLYKSFILLLTACFLPMLQSCKDDIDLSYGAPGSLEGDCRVSFNLQGMPLQTAMTRSDGKAIKSVRNLYVLFYTLDDINGVAGELAYAFTSDENCANDVFDTSLAIESTTDEDRNSFNPGSDGWSGSAEAKTQKVKTNSVMVGRGQYYIYVVANVDDFSKAGFSAEDINTPAKLKKYNLTWNSADIKSNDAMFGYFTTSSETGYDALDNKEPVITLSTNDTSLHAWIKRAASKVTVAFDGSNLLDNVNVYIKNVSIKDIPENCKLGELNSPASVEELVSDGEKIVYTASAGMTNDTRISKREPFFPNFTGTTDDDEAVNRWRQTVHSEDANALYFFENCQGMSTGNPDADGSWKQQTDNLVPGVPDDRTQNINKDTKKYGSYIEVEAYYVNNRFGSQTEGKIIYRFMLGMNTTNDFNARRNNHYKLTLCFKNNANDVDWHIDYYDEPTEYIPDVYVSYTYNTPTILPIRIVSDKKISQLSVRINSANWYPDDNSIPRYTGSTLPNDGLSTGFLSLTYDSNPRIRDNELNATGEYVNVQNYWNNQPNNDYREYYNNGKRSWSDLDEFGYNIQTRRTNEGLEVFEANIPMFTRPLTIYKWASWTGANPYYSSTRDAKLTVSFTYEGGQTINKTVTVKQVRRVENPTAIYRRHDNQEAFNVTLLEREGEGGEHSTPVKYIHFRSIGAWRATIYRSINESGATASSGGSAWFTINAGSQRISSVDAYLQGDSDSEIAFTYKPNGTIAQNQTRCGIIKIEYNNYNCTHYIFVRQGYAPMKMEESGKLYWHTFNMYSGSSETTHPAEAGSLFLRGYWAPAILDSNNETPRTSVSTLTVINSETGTNTSIISVPISNANYNRRDFQNNGARTLTNNNTTLNPWTTGRVPDVTEWATLLNENATDWFNRAFGVLYGDGATSTLEAPEQVYGCLHSDVNSGRTQKGMRGTIVYNTNTGRNLFFPIGASGYGRRKVAAAGQLQYGFGDTYSDLRIGSGTSAGPQRAPLENLWTNEGAIYWGLKENPATSASNNKKSNSWDINYKSYDFDYMDAEENNTSACYIRLVQDTAP